MLLVRTRIAGQQVDRDHLGRRDQPGMQPAVAFFTAVEKWDNIEQRNPKAHN